MLAKRRLFGALLFMLTLLSSAANSKRRSSCLTTGKRYSSSACRIIQPTAKPSTIGSLLRMQTDTAF